MTPPPLPPRPPQVFTRPSTATTTAWWLALAAIALILVGIGGFFLTLFSRQGGMVQLQAVCTIPMLGAFACATAAYVMARSPRQVAIDDHGINISSAKASRQSNWNQIAWAETLSQGVSQQKMLKIYGNDGKTLARLSGDLFGFDALVQLIKQHLAEHPSPHTLNVRLHKSKRRGTFLIIGAFVACALATAVGWFAWDEHHSNELLASKGIDGVGVVENKLVAPDGRTHRVEYRVTSGPKSHLHNVQVEVPLWETLNKADRLPVRTVPDHPEISRLVVGEVRDDFDRSPMFSAGLSAVVFMMGVVFLIVGIMGRRGIDVKYDSKSRKFRIERIASV